MGTFPVHPDEVTPQWLGAVLGARVDGVRWEPIGTGQVGDSVRFHVASSAAPATLAGKFPAADPASRGTAALFGLYRKEVEFYRQAAPLLGVRVPKTYAAQVSEDGADFILLFEDCGPARQGDQIASCSLEDARAAIVQAAALHATSWENSALLDAEWIQPAPGHGDRVAAMYPQAQAVFRDRYAETLEPEFMEVCEQLAEAAGKVFTRQQAPRCIVHGDFRLDNMLFDIHGGAEAVAILDWQTVTTGRGMTDIAYFIGCGLGETMWRAHERELLGLYFAEMERRGIALGREEALADYRFGGLHGVATAVFSAAFVERTERGDANFLSMARGACSLALEHDSIGALKELM